MKIAESEDKDYAAKNKLNLRVLFKKQGKSEHNPIREEPSRVGRVMAMKKIQEINVRKQGKSLNRDRSLGLEAPRNYFEEQKLNNRKLDESSDDIGDKNIHRLKLLTHFSSNRSHDSKQGTLFNSFNGNEPSKKSPTAYLFKTVTSELTALLSSLSDRVEECLHLRILHRNLRNTYCIRPSYTIFK